MASHVRRIAKLQTVERLNAVVENVKGAIVGPRPVEGVEKTPVTLLVLKPET